MSIIKQQIKETTSQSPPHSITTYDSYILYKQLQSNQDEKYKRELCYNFINKGVCKYNFKCRFAHGIDDLISKFQSNKSSFDQKTMEQYQSEIISLLKISKVPKRLKVFMMITSGNERSSSTKDNSFEYNSNGEDGVSEKKISKQKEEEKVNVNGKSKLRMLFD